MNEDHYDSEGRELLPVTWWDIPTCIAGFVADASGSVSRAFGAMAYELGNMSTLVARERRDRKEFARNVGYTVERLGEND
jgi:hypothetical protein